MQYNNSRLTKGCFGLLLKSIDEINYYLKIKDEIDYCIKLEGEKGIFSFNVSYLVQNF